MPPTVTAGNKRIIVHIVKGRLAGLPKIIGHLTIDALRPCPQTMFTSDYGHIDFVRDAPRYVMFRERP